MNVVEESVFFLNSVVFFCFLGVPGYLHDALGAGGHQLGAALRLQRPQPQRRHPDDGLHRRQIRPQFGRFPALSAFFFKFQFAVRGGKQKPATRRRRRETR